MLYQLYEMQHVAVAPMRFWADHGQHFFRNPYNPLSYTTAGRVIAAACDVVEHTTRRYGKPKFEIRETRVNGRTVPVEERNLARKTFGQLKHFKKPGRTKQPRLLIVAPMSGHFSTLLRGTVAAMVPDHDVYITDWRDARDVPLADGAFDLDDYIDYLIDWLVLLGPETHVMAVCQPVVPAMAAVSLLNAAKHPCTPPSMTLMGGPIDTRINPTLVNQLAQTRRLGWFERNVITHVPPPNLGFMRRVYPGFLQLAGFMSMNLGDHMIKHQEMFRHLIRGDGESAVATQDFYEEYRSVMDLTAEFYLQTVKTVFQDHALPEGTWESRGRPIEPGAIKKTAVLAIEGERDDISGIGQTKAALDITPNLASSKKHYYLANAVGHYGIFNGRRWREHIAPEVTAFIKKYS
ncbi:MAG: polyhydroxyalkanoate depolymerase [Sphingomonadales bacterium]|nr:polyhydroxyalkanoate depolymerase [Sphingomonadales bacterium]